MSDNSVYQETSIRISNHNAIMRDRKCRTVIQNMREVEDFLSEFGFLSFGRDFISCRKYVLSLQVLSLSSELTAGSIISCCESGCLADANSLLRKLRDDLFFYLYVVVFDHAKMAEKPPKEVRKMEENINRWIENNLSDLSIGVILKTIGQISVAKDAVTRYNMQSYFDSINIRLNNFVHGNGVFYYNRNVLSYKENALYEQLETILNDMRLIVVTFLFLLTLCAPLSIMSTDYIDYLEYNINPPEGSQYWVAPFITDFLYKNSDLIYKNCIDYLRENTSMEFE